MIGVKWTIKRFSPSLHGYDVPAPSLVPQGTKAPVFDTWPEVCDAADTILGQHDLERSLQPADPVVIKHGDDIVIIYLTLEFTD